MQCTSDIASERSWLLFLLNLMPNFIENVTLFDTIVDLAGNIDFQIIFQKFVCLSTPLMSFDLNSRLVLQHMHL